MAQKLYDEEKIRAIAVKIREQAGSTTQYTTSQMPSGVDEVYNKGYNDGLSAGGGSEGVELPTLTNPGIAEDLLLGKELIDGEGNVVTGTATYSTLYLGLAAPSNDLGNDGDIYIIGIGGAT